MHTFMITMLHTSGRSPGIMPWQYMATSCIIREASEFSLALSIDSCAFDVTFTHAWWTLVFRLLSEGLRHSFQLNPSIRLEVEVVGQCKQMNRQAALWHRRRAYIGNHFWLLKEVDSKVISKVEYDSHGNRKHTHAQACCDCPSNHFTTVICPVCLAS